MPNQPRLCAALSLALAPPLALAQPGVTLLLSRAHVGGSGNERSGAPAAGGSGVYAFQSLATNLTAGDSNSQQDVFLWTPGQDLPELVSRASAQGNGPASNPAVSLDGSIVAFDSLAGNLTPDDFNGLRDVFVRDRAGGSTQLISISISGRPGAAESVRPSISADGRFVVFESDAPDLVPGDTNGARDVFVRDRALNQTRRVSVSSLGAQGNGPSQRARISADGLFVTFDSTATNLVPSDTNARRDVFLHDLFSGQTVLVSANDADGQGDGDSFGPAPLSADGRFIAFQSFASNLVLGDTNGTPDVFVRDAALRTTELASRSTQGIPGRFTSANPSLSADGRFVAFSSIADNLVAGDTNQAEDVFVRDRLLARTRRASVTSAGTQAGGASTLPALSSDGRFVAFQSRAANFVTNDLNGLDDVFVHELPCPADLNLDGRVNDADVATLVDFFEDENPALDLSLPEGLDLLDFFAFFNAFDAGC